MNWKVRGCFGINNNISYLLPLRLLQFLYLIEKFVYLNNLQHHHIPEASQVFVCRWKFFARHLILKVSRYEIIDLMFQIKNKHLEILTIFFWHNPSNCCIFCEVNSLAFPAADRSLPAASSGSATVSLLANSASADAANDSSLSVSCFNNWKHSIYKFLLLRI